MEKILFVNACIKPDSRTLMLAKHVLGALTGEVEEVKLYDQELLPLTLKELEVRDSAAKSRDFSDELFKLPRQFAGADVIVIAAPYWDLMFPAVVKNYLEKITVSGLTFTYGQNGIPCGLCRAKKLIYVTTAGGPILCNFGYDYIAALAREFYGIQETSCVKAEGLDVYGADVCAILEEAKAAFTQA